LPGEKQDNRLRTYPSR